jgi:hypothetical protein
MSIEDKILSRVWPSRESWVADQITATDVNIFNKISFLEKSQIV